jgi:hypothetical protein
MPVILSAAKNPRISLLPLSVFGLYTNPKSAGKAQKKAAPVKEPPFPSNITTL